jgi:hypothetical protein
MNRTARKRRIVFVVLAAPRGAGYGRAYGPTFFKMGLRPRHAPHRISVLTPQKPALRPPTPYGAGPCASRPLRGLGAFSPLRAPIHAQGMVGTEGWSFPGRTKGWG